MAKADDTSNPAITAQSPSTFIPLRRTSQCNQHPGCATLYLDSSAASEYLDSSAASEDLFDTARRRLESAIGTLSVLDLLDETEEPGESICRITGSLLSLLSDALSLFEAEYARRHR
ncbi:hypothetical protein ACV34L_31525 [Pseudomonas aeruginosa]|uniref:hypothetical protein n=6 Tax=Gammaproteobacteria TaxID=1236 RepID=UPI000E6A615F|nr:hypothetical protein [Pseudomonas aeruginosa]MCG7049211.1 hypothetical protein [Pseudomonas aeruginosa]RIY93982.1 hypothetical protein AXW94_18005 [Pseudomonas aeruginosa]RPX33753.1 hypothetical protein IPC720_22620 [Pseudomonas aeruginosa]UWU59482.1 hypothetical protein NDR95_15955 [Pseudomonas aeruginosa]HBN8254331.1 hypothetical protein [Pseudomonas aeruginosa]